MLHVHVLAAAPLNVFDQASNNSDDDVHAFFRRAAWLTLRSTLRSTTTKKPTTPTSSTTPATMSKRTRLPPNRDEGEHCAHDGRSAACPKKLSSSPGICTCCAAISVGETFGTRHSRVHIRLARCCTRSATLTSVHVPARRRVSADGI